MVVTATTIEHGYFAVTAGHDRRGVDLAGQDRQRLALVGRALELDAGIRTRVGQKLVDVLY